jgi:formate hydrogenlyase transcriptional activator
VRAPESFVSAGEASQLKSNGDGRAGALLLAERRTLELIADGAALIEILEELCRTVDAQQPDVISSVLLTDTDGKRLWPAAGPRIPTAWTKAITPLPIGPDIGACGTAAFLKQTVIVSDIATDPLFDLADYRSLALSNGLRAAWSQPLVSKDGEVLGTFGMYYAEPREPSADDLQLIGGAAHIAMIAVQRDRTQKELERAYQDIKQSEEKLRQDEEELRRITDLIPQTIIVLSPDGRAVYANRVVLDYTGLSIEEVWAEDFRSRVFHPDDVQRLREERNKTLAGIAPFENEQRALGKDGKYRWFLIRYNPFLDEEGQVIRWYATGTDIDERKRAEDRARNESVALREEIVRSSMFEEIVGSSDELRKVLAQVARVAPTDSTVLIQGETGTGKELIARAIHKSSRRATRAFISVNCGAIPSSLIASELFGHEKGAFTGATQRRLGRFEAADGGTIFLDEVGELPADTQIALLRVLQELEFERVGSNQPISVDVRVIAATNGDLEAAMARGDFRQDLFYRLNVFPIRTPPLRERVDDIPLLVEYLIERYAKQAGKKIRNINKKTLKLFQDYDWPGNVRELQNVVERAVILSDGETFCVDETWLRRDKRQPSGPTVTLPLALEEREREAIETALAESRGRVGGPAGAAAKLGVPRQTLESKIKMLGINKYRFKTT